MNRHRTVVLLSAVLLLVSLFAQGCECSDKTATKRVTIDVCGDGVVFLNGRRIQKDQLRETLKELADSAPTEKVYGRKLPLVDVLIRTEFDVRCETAANVIDSCAIVGIRRTYFSNPEVNSGNEVKLWLPICGSTWRTPRIEAESMVEKPIILLEEEVEIVGPDNEEQKKQENGESNQGAASPLPGDAVAGSNRSQPRNQEKNPSITLSDIRIKLLWVDSENPTKTLAPSNDPEGTRGMMALKVKDMMLMKHNRPDWKKLSKLLRRMVENFRPTRSYKAPPVIIDPRPKVFFADVLRCVVLCQESGIDDIMLAAPEIPY